MIGAGPCVVRRPRTGRSPAVVVGYDSPAAPALQAVCLMAARASGGSVGLVRAGMDVPGLCEQVDLTLTAVQDRDDESALEKPAGHA